MSPDVGLAWFQGVYYLATGIWPLISIRTFMLVTGPKRDIWLVRMVGLLAAAIGGPLVYAAWSGMVDVQLALVAVLAALAFTAVDVYYWVRGVIGKVYLLDALLEVAVILLWGVVLLR